VPDHSVDDQLLVEEYKSCRDLIAKNIDIMEKTEVYAVGASAAIIVFSLSATVRAVGVVSAWLPLVIAILGFVRFLGLDDTIDKINNHLIELERKYASINWTTFYREHNKKKVLKKTRYGIWFALMIVSLVFAFYMTFEAPVSGLPGTPKASAKLSVLAPKNSG
jgi:hypothetical protein